MVVNTEEEIKAQYAKEATDYRSGALKVNYEFDLSWEELKKVEAGLTLLQNKQIIVCYGRRDFCFNRYFYNEWKRRFPNAEYHTFNAGHYTLEDAGPEIFELVTKFFNSKA